MKDSSMNRWSTYPDGDIDWIKKGGISLMESKLSWATGLSYLGIAFASQLHAAQAGMAERLHDIGIIVRRMMGAGAAALLLAGLFSGAYALCLANLGSQGQMSFLFFGTFAIVACVRYVTESRTRQSLTAGLQQLTDRFPGEQTAQEMQGLQKIRLEVQEEERRRIAADLHDTTMQDLFFLKRKLAAVLDNYMVSREDEKQLKRLIHLVELINVGLRQTCFELDPYLLQEIGFVNTLSMYLDQERGDSLFHIEFAAEETVALEAQDVHTKRHLFRVVQELLNNAKKHSQASKVTFHLTESEGWVRLIYEDNGIGFEEKQMVREIGLSGQGLEQLKARISQLNGQIRLETGKGEGVKLMIMIPVWKADQVG